MARVSGSSLSGSCPRVINEIDVVSHTIHRLWRCSSSGFECAVEEFLSRIMDYGCPCDCFSPDTDESVISRSCRAFVSGIFDTVLHEVESCSVTTDRSCVPF